MLVMEEVPSILSGRWTHSTEHRQAPIFAFGGAVGRSSSGSGVFGDGGERRQAIDLKRRKARHGGLSYFAEALAAAVGDLRTGFS